jgi:hypothetical protein
MERSLHMDGETTAFLARLAQEAPGITSIWLLGSRANRTATASSDWDFIAFGTEPTLAFLQEATHLHRPEIDFLVVTNGEDFHAAWGERDKTGSLTEWQWSWHSEIAAEYMQAKQRKDGSGADVSQAASVRVWP